MSEAPNGRPVGGGRIVLDTFRSVHDPMLRSWLLFREQILAGSDRSAPPLRVNDTSAPGQGLYGVWRVLATNNRELGRCASLHPAPFDAFVAAEAARAEAEQLTASVVRGTQPMTHSWVLRREGAPVLTASRWYESASEANAAAKAARRILAGATIVDGVSIGTQSGRRHRRAIAPSDPRV